MGAAGWSDGRAGGAVAWSVPALLVLLTLVAYRPVLDNELVNWDDDVNLQKNEAYRGLGWKQLRWMFGSSHQGHYQPLTWVSYALDYRLWGERAFGFHLTNLILHSANAVAFYALARSLLARTLPKYDQAGRGLQWPAAALAAATFAVHPLRVESVAWATERRDVLSGLFFLLTLLAYVRTCRPGTGRRPLWLSVTLALYALGLLSKVMLVSLPVVLVILDVYPLGRLTGRSWFGGSARRVWLEKLPFVVLAALAAGAAMLAQADADSMLSLAEYGVGQRLVQTAYGLAFYLYKTIVPLGLSPLYELPPRVELSHPPYLAGVIVASAITVSLIALRRRFPAGLAAWAAYLVILLPVSGIVQNGPQITADRYTYLACLGWTLLLGGAAFAVRALGRIGAWLLVLLGCLAVAGLSLLTAKQALVWGNSESLWRRAVQVEPASRLGRHQLGITLADQGRHGEALERYDQVLVDLPGYAKLHFDRGVSLAVLGRLEEAIAAYERTIERQPEYTMAYFNLGSTLLRVGRTEDAVSVLRVAVEKRPSDADAHYNLGVALTAAGRTEASMASYRQALGLRPTHELARFNLGLLLVGQGRHAEAMGLAREGTALAPRNLKVVNLLAWLRSTSPQDDLRDGAEAVRLAEACCQAGDLSDPAFLHTLAAAYAEVGRFAEAVATAKKALRLAEESGQTRLAEQIRHCLDLYEAGKPFRSGPGTTSRAD